MQAPRASARTVRPEVCRFVSTGPPPCLRPLRVPSGTRWKAACLLRTGSATFLEALHPAPVPGQFSPGAEYTPQILAKGETPFVDSTPLHPRRHRKKNV